MPPKDRTPSVQDAIAALRADKTLGRGRGRRSPVYRWLADNREALAVEFARSGPSWAVLARYLGEHGVTDADGKPPSPMSARSAWYRINRDHKKAASETARVASTVRPIPSPPPVQPPPPAADKFHVQDILDRLGGRAARGTRLPKRVE